MELTPEYKEWIYELKEKVRFSQIKAAISVNSTLILFYWEIGKMISQKMELRQWGDKIINVISNDLLEEFPNMKGLSVTNLKYCKRFYEFYYKQINNTILIGQQVVDLLNSTENQLLLQQSFTKIPWGHNILIFTKSENFKIATFYIEQTIENNWN